MYTFSLRERLNYEYKSKMNVATGGNSKYSKCS